jgi:hypothetical protein
MLPALIALLFAAIGGGVELHIGDLLLTALLLCGLSMLLGVLWPHQAWRWGVLVGAGVPIAHALAAWQHWLPPDENHLAASWLALLPAMVGALGGMALRRAMAALRDNRSW